MATTKGYDSIMIEEEMALLRFSGILEILETNNDEPITIKKFNKDYKDGKIPELIENVLEGKTEMFVLCGFASKLNPLLLTELEKEVLVKVIVKQNAKKESQFFNGLSVVSLSLVEGFSEILLNALKTIFSHQNNIPKEKQSVRPKANPQDIVEALGKHHMEKAERERLAGRTTTSIPS